jgi:hypothetical protein
MAEDDPRSLTQRLRGANIVEITGAQKLRAHHAHQRHPAEQDGDASSHQKFGCTTLESRMIRNSVGMPDQTSMTRWPHRSIFPP